MAEENDFTLKIDADDSGVRKTLEKLQADFKNKPVVIDIKGKIDPSLQKALSSISSLKKKNSAGGSASDILLKEQRKAANSTRAFSAAVAAASAALTAFQAKLSRGFPAAGSALAPAMGFASTPAGQMAHGVNQALMGFPGAIQLAQMAMRPIQMGMAFGRDSVAAFNTQNRAELQLKQVLKNNGMGESEFNSVKSHAANLQARTTIGDEAMIAGAGELSTYVKDGESMKRMMNLLADYAVGMNENSPNLNSHQMVEFATSLGKAFDGTYDAMRKKGFDTSELEALKKLEDAGQKVTEGQKIEALERALKDWNGLAENIARTDEGKIVQLNNTIGDLKENVGKDLLPAIGNFSTAISQNLPAIENFFQAFTNGSQWFIESGTQLINIVTPLIKLLSKIAVTISNNMVPAVGAVTVSVGVATGAFVKLQAQILQTSMTMLSNMNSVAGGAQQVAGGLGSIKSAAGSLLKSGMLGILAAEILAIGNAAWQAWKASRDAKKRNDEYAKKVSDTDPMLKAYNDLKDAEGRGSAGDIINSRRDLESYAQSYYDKNGVLPDYIAKKLGWDWANNNPDPSPAPGPAFKPPTIAPPPPMKVTQNNYISTEFDSLGKLIKENLREIAISRLTFKTSSEAAKAMAV